MCLNMADGEEVPSKNFKNMIQSSSPSDESELSSGSADSENDKHTQLGSLKYFRKNRQKPRIHSDDHGASGIMHYSILNCNVICATVILIN